MGTRVDFYIIDATGDAVLELACRIAEKAWLGGHRIFIRTASEGDALRLDDLLWTWKQDSFVPHGIHPGAGDDELPVLLGCGEGPPGEPDVLINLGEQVLPSPERFTRIAELVGGDEEARTAGRSRYRQYRELGFTLETHHL